MSVQLVSVHNAKPFLCHHVCVGGGGAVWVCGCVGRVWGWLCVCVCMCLCVCVGGGGVCACVCLGLCGCA